jgi:preprotein translocase subunit SecF
LLAARDTDHSGIVTSFDQLKNVDGVTPAVLSSLNTNFVLGNFTIRNVEIVGPKVGAQLRHQAIWATMYALGGMLIYIAFRFEWVYGAAAVIAVFHDVLITLGFFSLFHFEISLTVIAALLTLVGYSMNDTIVIFDRVREDQRLMRREAFSDVVNKAINQTLSRTILTSGLTFLTVLVLFLMGGEVLRAFSFAMVVGVVVGTYSSFGIAAPIVVVWNKYRGQGTAVRAGSAADKRVVAAARR